MRIYPYALRVTSSNLDPAFHWRRGAQLVALNWQSLDKGMMLNYGMFAGTQGWALKPPGYRSSEGPTDSIVRTTVELKIDVFAGQDLALPKNTTEKGFSPYVVCQLHVEEPEGPVAADRDDASDDTDKSSYRRHTKTASGRNPDFEAQSLVFPTVVDIVEELSFVRLVFLFLPTFSYSGFATSLAASLFAFLPHSMHVVLRAYVRRFAWGCISSVASRLVFMR